LPSIDGSEARVRRAPTPPPARAVTMDTAHDCIRGFLAVRSRSE
jgi:hypothetical protein